MKIITFFFLLSKTRLSSAILPGWIDTPWSNVAVIDSEGLGLLAHGSA